MLPLEVILLQPLSYTMDLFFLNLFSNHSKLSILLNNMKNHGNRKNRKAQKVYFYDFVLMCADYLSKMFNKPVTQIQAQIFRGFIVRPSWQSPHSVFKLLLMMLKDSLKPPLRAVFVMLEKAFLVPLFLSLVPEFTFTENAFFHTAWYLDQARE